MSVLKSIKLKQNDHSTKTKLFYSHSVFAEHYTGQKFEANHIPEHVNADDWVKEILALPKDASYQEWMFEHPDGRSSVGYRTGNHVIKKAMEKSDKTILELSNLAPNEIIKLAGY